MWIKTLRLEGRNSMFVEQQILGSVFLVCVLCNFSTAHLIHTQVEEHGIYIKKRFYINNPTSKISYDYAFYIQ